MKALLLAGLLLSTESGTQAQTIRVIKVESANRDKRQLLNSFFPIDDIVSIKVTNNNGTHLLTMKELKLLKEQLKQARFAGGLLIKPNHIIVAIKLAGNASAKPGFVYASTGAIHFEDGIDKSKQRFSGTFNLPTKLNFDNYR